MLSRIGKINNNDDSTFTDFMLDAGLRAAADMSVHPAFSLGCIYMYKWWLHRLNFNFTIIRDRI